MNNNYYAVIMAGGVGSRFWPMSTQEFPKQFHDMLGTGDTLIQRTFSRINELVPASNILIATNARYENLVLEQLPKATKNQLLLEPAMRNTAPCILYAALKVYHQNPNAVMLIAPSDHWIDNEKEFIRNIDTSFKACSENDILMTLGIQPDHPNTGYGYIQFEKDKSEIKKVKNFTEKPNIEKAKDFLASGDYLWNAGIFIWSERAENVHVLPVDFGWNDLGTWGSLYNKLDKDTEKNAIVGADAVFRDSNGNMIKTQNNKKVIIQGLQDFIVVEKDDVLLICPRKDDQDIKQIMKDAKENFGNEYV